MMLVAFYVEIIKVTNIERMSRAKINKARYDL